MARKLKVYRAVAGFDDAYVAAPSQKAALRAWDADHDLFARGQAEVVTDPALTEEPLARPGEVILRSRGGLQEQLKALRAGKPNSRKAAGEQGRKAAPRRPPPSRSKVEAAERALETARKRHLAQEEALERKRAELREKLRALQESHRSEIRRLEGLRDEARDAYQEALRQWDEEG